MRPPYTVKTCESCGHEYPTKRPDRAKFCEFCSTVGGILAFRERTATCIACEEVFCPVVARDTLCGKCSFPSRFSRGSVSGTCRACNAESVWLADKEIPLCGTCIRHPKKRTKLVAQLAEKRRERAAKCKNPRGVVRKVVERPLAPETPSLPDF